MTTQIGYSLSLSLSLARSVSLSLSLSLSLEMSSRGCDLGLRASRSWCPVAILVPAVFVTVVLVPSAETLPSCGQTGHVQGLFNRIVLDVGRLIKLTPLLSNTFVLNEACKQIVGAASPIGGQLSRDLNMIEVVSHEGFVSTMFYSKASLSSRLL